ncbi:hypothetical protein HDU78_010800 [Chytriomyces hyalinus]|nr:hypothetical protein HDU78_010800 [Chytriomyces hyalinus]
MACTVTTNSNNGIHCYSINYSDSINCTNYTNYTPTMMLINQVPLPLQRKPLLGPAQHPTAPPATHGAMQAAALNLPALVKQQAAPNAERSHALNVHYRFTGTMIYGDISGLCMGLSAKVLCARCAM